MNYKAYKERKEYGIKESLGSLKKWAYLHTTEEDSTERTLILGGDLEETCLKHSGEIIFIKVKK